MSSSQYEENHIDEVPEETIAFRQPGLRGKLARWRKRISVEPVLFLFYFGTFLQNIVIVNLALDKACHVNFHRESCGAESKNETSLQLFRAPAEVGDDNDVQAYVATWNIYRSVLENVPCVLFTLFLGPWSDIHGRKLPMMLPLAGQILSSGLYITFFLLPYTSLEYLLIASIPIGLSGGWVSLLMSVYSYLSDITKEKSRTTRLAFLDLFAYVAVPLGNVASRYLYIYGGYLWIFGSSAGCMLLALMYVAFFVPNTKDPASPLRFDIQNPEPSGPEVQTDDLLPQKSIPSSGGCCQVFNCNNIKDSAVATFRPRPDFKRAVVLLSLVAMAVYVTGNSGYSNVSYLYARKIFGWDEPEFVTFQAVQVSMSAIGTMLLLPFLSFKLKVSDPVLGLMAMASLIAMNLLYAFASAEWMFYLGALMSLPSGAGTSVIRSTISKSVANEELGKVFSMLGSLESLTPLLGSTIYNISYQATLSFFPGFVCLLTAGLELIQASIYMALLCIMRRISNPHRILVQSE